MAYISNGESTSSVRDKINQGLLVPATEVSKSGSVLEIRIPEGAKYFYFTAPSDYSASDTYIVNGVKCNLFSQNNTTPQNAWKSGAIVKMFKKSAGTYFVYDSASSGGGGDYLPITGGTLTGDLRIGAESYGGKINFGSEDSVYLYENEENKLEIKASDINFLSESISLGRKSGTTIGQYSFAIGSNVEASGNYSHAEGVDTLSNGVASHSEGCTTASIGEYSHAEGLESSSIGASSHAEGYATIASGSYSHTEGFLTSASSYSHAEGNITTASGSTSHAEGNGTTASGSVSHAEGNGTTASGDFSHASGYATTASGDFQFVCGKYNVAYEDSSAPYSYFIVGKGYSSGALSNCFRVTDTAVYGGTYNSSGADYAEYFEWKDAPQTKDENIGKFVTLDGENVRLATSKDDWILGIVSASPSIIGDSADDQWNNMYEKDIFGRIVFENTEVSILKGIVDGEEVFEKTMQLRPKLNPDYRENERYIPRSERLEWCIVGIIGKLVVVDDGTCVPNGWCKCNDNSIATNSESQTKFRVMSRIDQNHIRVMILP